MQRYLDKLQVTLHRFKEWTLQHVPWDQSSDADALVNLGSSVEYDDFKSGEWVEAQAYEKVREKEVIDFILDHIICRFGLPLEIVCDNRKQFIGSKVTKLLEDHKIKRILSTPYHPRGNGQAELNNKTIIQNLKKRLTDAKGKLKEILPEVLWEYRTTAKSSTRVTPFSLVYGTEALILVEVGEPSIRFQYPTKELNDEAMNTSLELLDERCEAAIVRLASQKQLIEMYYNRRPNF
ncbi:uncharacterized protein [Nicotiana tomentosiformis]|uniref:uncharacterized protein n=1 Tax=Nicotiana tomentosiformis TaxID=4098 RepID=UPI00388C5D0D